MRLSKDLLSILVCPESKQPLHLISKEQCDTINAAIAAGTMKTVTGTTVDSPIDSGLMREDESILYAIRNEIPVLLYDEALSLS